MKRPRVWLSRLLGMFRGRAADRELDDELESHVALHVEDLVRSGVEPGEAHRLALARLGGVQGVKEAYRDRQGWPVLETVFRDVRYAVRAAAKHPGFVAVAVLNLAIGIGVNTAVFSVVNAIILRRPQYADPDRLVTVRQRFPALGEATLGTAQAEFLDYRDRSQAFSSIAGHESAVFDLTGGSEPVRIQAEKATHTLFATLGVAPIIGRTFVPQEDHEPAPLRRNQIVIGYELWQQRFGCSPGAIGSVLRLDEQPYTVVGVMPAGFEFPFTRADVGEPPVAWMPIAFTREEIADRASEFPVHIVARLAPSVTRAQAEQDVQRVASGFEREHADIYSGNLRLELSVQPLGSASAARARPALFALSGAVLFVLLIACANVTNLLLARAALRQREIAMRRALGASAGRLVAQLVTEGLLFTAIGAIAGCLLAFTILTGLRRFLPWLSAGGSVRIDWPVLAFTIVISVITGLVCGLAPAAGLRGSGSDVTSALKTGGRDNTSAPRRRVRGILVVVEAACAVVLLIGASLLLRSFIEVVRVPLGFSPDDVVMVRTTFNRARYPSDDRRREAERAMAERLAALPGVQIVGVTTHIPLADERQIGFILEGEDEHAARWADNATVSGSYFQAMGIPLLRGRTFGEQDAPGAPRAAIVNDSMARRFWPAGDALGKRIVWGGLALWRRASRGA